MKKLSKILAVVLSLVLCLGLLATTGYAAEAEKDGLKLTLTTDKEEYTEDEKIVATLKVENTTGVAMNNVVMTIVTPEGLNVAAGAATKTVETLAAGASESLEITCQRPLNPETGDSSVVFICAIALVCCLAMIGLIWNRRTVAMALAVVMVFGMAMMGMPVNAAEVSTEVITQVKVNGQAYELKATVTAEAEAPKPEEPAASTYVKVTEDLEDWTGTYLVVCDDPSVMKIWDASQAVAGAGVDVTIVDGKITGNYSAMAIIVGKSDDGSYYVQLPNGNYLSGGGKANYTTTESTTPKAATFDLKNKGCITASNGAMLWTGKKFAMVSLSDLIFGIGSRIRPYLYKLEAEKPAVPAYAKVTEDLEDWTGTYLVVCDDPSVMKIWDASQAVAGTGVDVAIVDGKITGDYSTMAIIVGKSDDGTYYVQLPNGKYLSGGGKANYTTTESTTPKAATFDLKNKGCITASNGAMLWTGKKFAMVSLSDLIFGIGSKIRPNLYKLQEG